MVFHRKDNQTSSQETREEKIANAERAVQEALKRQAAFPQGDYSNKAERAAALEAIPGHPLRALTRENDALAVLLAEMKAALDRREDVSVLFERIREISVHYSKKGDLLFRHTDADFRIGFFKRGVRQIARDANIFDLFFRFNGFQFEKKFLGCGLSYAFYVV